MVRGARGEAAHLGVVLDGGAGPLLIHYHFDHKLYKSVGNSNAHTITITLNNFILFLIKIPILFQ